MERLAAILNVSFVTNPRSHHDDVKGSGQKLSLLQRRETASGPCEHPAHEVTLQTVYGPEGRTWRKWVCSKCHKKLKGRYEAT